MSRKHKDGFPLDGEAARESTDRATLLPEKVKIVQLTDERSSESSGKIFSNDIATSSIVFWRTRTKCLVLSLAVLCIYIFIASHQLLGSRISRFWKFTGLFSTGFFTENDTAPHITCV